MARALIEINTVVGSNNDLPIDTLVQLSNSDNGGELTYLWEWIDKPEGSLAAFSDPAIENPTFTPDVEGTYLIRLTVNRTLATESVNKVICGVKQMKSGMRVPAAGETTEESTSRGWARDLNRLLRILDSGYADPTVITGQADVNLAKGDVIVITDMATIKAGLPGEELVPVFEKAQASSANEMDRTLYVAETDIAGNTSITANELFRARLAGIIGPLALGAGSALDPVYVTDAAALSVTPGTYTRRIGHIVYIDGSDYYVSVDGSLNHHEGALRLFGANAKIRQQSGDLTIQTETSNADINLMANAADRGWNIDGASGKLSATPGPYKVSNVDTPTSSGDAVNKDYVDANFGGMVLYFGNEDTPGSADEAALDPGHGARTSPLVAGAYPSLRVPRAGKLAKLYVSAFTGPGTSGIDITVYVNGSPTTITCTLAAAGTSASDTSHATTVAAGDLVSIHVKGNGGISAGATEISASLLFTNG